MIGLPAPPRMTVPEFGIQFGLPKLLQSLPEGMNTAIMEKLAAWDRPKCKLAMHDRRIYPLLNTAHFTDFVSSFVKFVHSGRSH